MPKALGRKRALTDVMFMYLFPSPSFQSELPMHGNKHPEIFWGLHEFRGLNFQLNRPRRPARSSQTHTPLTYSK